MTIDRPQRILVILDDIGPGDALRSTFALNAIRRARPDSHIALLVSDRAAEVFEHASDPDQLLVSRLYARSSGGRWARRIHKLKEAFRLRREIGPRHDLVLVLNWGTSTLDLLGWLSGHRVVGYENRLRFLLSVRLGRYDVEGDPVEQNQKLLEAAGVSMADPAPASDAGLPVASGQDIARPYAVLHTGSDWACQQWSKARWAELADRLVEEFGLTIVFSGLAAEGTYIADIRSLMHQPAMSFAGKTTVAGLKDLLRRAALCVSVDSAPYELAQLTGTPVVILAGPTSGRPQMRMQSHPIVVNRTPAQLGRVIRECQRSHADGHCHDYGCPMSQLPLIEVDDVMQGISRLGVGARSAAAAR